jgi:hypothetical protein
VEDGWPGLVFIGALVLLVVGGIAGWDMDPNDAFVAAVVLGLAGWGGYMVAGTVWTAVVNTVRRHRRRRP